MCSQPCRPGLTKKQLGEIQSGVETILARGKSFSLQAEQAKKLFRRSNWRFTAKAAKERRDAIDDLSSETADDHEREPDSRRIRAAFFQHDHRRARSSGNLSLF